MKNLRIALTSLFLLLACASSSFAATTMRVYNSGILVLAFLGFCALVVVIQLIPAIMTVLGMIRGVVQKGASELSKG